MSIDIRCAIAGNVDSGKSSLIGYLTKGVVLGVGESVEI